MPYTLLAAAEANNHHVAVAKKFADENLLANAEMWDKGHESPEPVLREAISLFTPTALAEKLGGHGESFTTLCRIYEELSKTDLGFTCALAVHTNVTVALSLSANTELRDRYLPGLLSGEAIGSFLLTEPNAGSDAASMTTLATQNSDGYSISGNKAWVTNGRWSDFLAVFCQTKPGSGAKGVAAFTVERNASGVTIDPTLDLIGSTAMGTTDAQFASVQVGERAIAFPSGEAFKAAMFGINVARLGVAAMCNGALAGALSHGLDYAGQRETFGKSVLSHQGMQWILADVATELECSRSLTFQAARLFDNQQDATILAAHAKKKATKTAFDGISQSMRALGANGLKRAYDLPRQLAAARVAECMDGTGEVMNIIIGRGLSANSA